MTRLIYAVPESQSAGSGGLSDALVTLARAIGELPTAELPALIGQLARLDATARLRLIGGRNDVGGDLGLLTAESAAEILGTTVDWLYRHAANLPFTVVLSPGQLRFSKTGIRDFIARGGKR